MEAAAYRYHSETTLRATLWPPPEGYPWKKHVSLAWTREALLRNLGGGRLICTWTTGGFCEPTAGNFTMIALSDDDGETWRDAGRFEHPFRGLFTTELFVPRPGTVHAFLHVYDSGRWFSHNQVFRTISQDGGETWTPPHSVPGGVPPGWLNIGLRHSSGRWIIPLTWPEFVGDEWGEPATGRAPAEARIGKRVLPQAELPRETESWIQYAEANAWCHRNHRYPAGALISDDDGRTFRLAGYLCGGCENHLMEPQVVELGSGRVAMLLRSMSEGVLLASYSNDAGSTWSQLERTSIPNPSSKINILRHSDGRIFLLHNPAGDTRNLMAARNPLSLWVSDDDMRTWNVKMDLVERIHGEHGLNYPSGYLDEQRDLLRFAWEDSHSVFLVDVPLSIGSHKLPAKPPGDFPKENETSILTSRSS